MCQLYFDFMIFFCLALVSKQVVKSNGNNCEIPLIYKLPLLTRQPEAGASATDLVGFA